MGGSGYESELSTSRSLIIYRVLGNKLVEPRSFENWEVSFWSLVEAEVWHLTKLSNLDIMLQTTIKRRVPIGESTD